MISGSWFEWPTVFGYVGLMVVVMWFVMATPKK